MYTYAQFRLCHPELALLNTVTDVYGESIYLWHLFVFCPVL